MPNFVAKICASQVKQCFGKTDENQWIFYSGILNNLNEELSRKTETNLHYSNNGGFNVVVVASL